MACPLAPLVLLTALLGLLPGISAGAQTPSDPGSNQEVGGSGFDLERIILGQEDPPPEALGIISVFIDGAQIADLETFIVGEHFYLQTGALEGLLFDRLSAPSYAQVFGKALRGRAWAGSQHLIEGGLGVIEDSGLLAFRITVPPGLRPATSITLSQTRTVNLKPILLPSTFSAVLNLELQAGLSYASGNALRFPLSLIGDGFINLYDWIFEAAGRVAWSTELTGSLQQLRAVRDLGSLQARFILGTVQSGSLGYQQASSLYGASLESYSFSQARKAQAVPVSEFTIETKSAVKILLNDAILADLVLDPGNYQVGDFDFAPGINDFIIEIQDESGSIRRFLAAISREDILLPAEVREFSAAAGRARDETVFEDPLGDLSGNIFYRVGLSDTLTAGLYASGSYRPEKAAVMAGINTAWASPFGAFRLNAAGVFDIYDSIPAPKASLRYRLVFPGRVLIPAIALEAEYTGKGFDPPRSGTSQADTPASLGFTAQITARFPLDFFLGATATWLETYGDKGAQTLAATLSLSKTLVPGYSFMVSASGKDLLSSKPELGLTFRLSASPRGSTRSLNISQSPDGSTMVEVGDSARLSGGTDTALEMINPLGSGSQPPSLALSLKKGFPFFDLGGSGRLGYTLDSNPGDRRSIFAVDTAVTTFSVSGGLAFVNGTFALARKISDSFVIFVPEASLTSERVDVRTESGQNATSRAGQPVVLPLSSYRTVAASLNLPESGPDILPALARVALSPRYRSGIFFSTGAVRSHSVSGTLVDAEGKPLGYIMAEVFNEMGDAVASTFTDETGYFELYDLASGTFEIRWPPDIGLSYFIIPETAPRDTTLGTIVPVALQEGAL